MATALGYTEQEKEEYRRRLNDLKSRAQEKLNELRKKKEEEKKD
jgi:hypothetical protein